MQGRKGSKGHGRVREGIGVAVAAEQGINASEAARGAFHAVASRRDAVTKLIPCNNERRN